MNYKLVISFLITCILYFQAGYQIGIAILSILLVLLLELLIIFCCNKRNSKKINPTPSQPYHVEAANYAEMPLRFTTTSSELVPFDPSAFRPICSTSSGNASPYSASE